MHDPYTYFQMAKAADGQDVATGAVVGAGAGAAAGYAAQRMAQGGAQAAAPAAQAAGQEAGRAANIVKTVARTAVPIAMSLISRRMAAPKPIAPAAASFKAKGAPATMRTAQPGPGAGQNVPAAPSMQTGGTVTSQQAMPIHKTVMAALEKAAGFLDPADPATGELLVAVVDEMRKVATELWLEAPLWEKAASQEAIAPLMDTLDFLEISYQALAKKARFGHGPATAQLASNAAQAGMQNGASWPDIEASFPEGHVENSAERDHLIAGNHPDRLRVRNERRALVGAAVGATLGYGAGLAAERIIPGAPKAMLPAAGILLGGHMGHELTR